MIKLCVIATLFPLSLYLAAVAAQLLKKRSTYHKAVLESSWAFLSVLGSRLKGLHVLKMSQLFFHWR